MTQTQVPWFEWGSSGLGYGRAPYNTCSPALTQLNHYLAQHARSRSLGCYVVRSVVGGSTISAHSYGGAIDVGWPDGGTADYWNQWLIDHSEELGVSAIIDERAIYLPNGGRYFKMWYPGKGWHYINAGGAGYLGSHIEVRRDKWGDGRSVDEKLAGNPPPPPPPPGGGYDPMHHNYWLFPLDANKPELKWLDGWQPSDPKRGHATYFNHVCVIEGGQKIRAPYEIFTGSEADDPSTAVGEAGSITALRNLNNFFNGNGANAGLAFEAYVGVCGKEAWKLIDAMATNWGRPR
jgi:hypothetical protein